MIRPIYSLRKKLLRYLKGSAMLRALFWRSVDLGVMVGKPPRMTKPITEMSEDDFENLNLYPGCIYMGDLDKKITPDMAATLGHEMSHAVLSHCGGVDGERIAFYVQDFIIKELKAAGLGDDDDFTDVLTEEEIVEVYVPYYGVDDKTVLA